MYKMMRILYVVAVLSIYGVIETKAARYQLIETRKNWLDADRDCRSRDGHLLTLDTREKARDFEKHMNITVSVWTSGYRMHSPWIWMEGCFSIKHLDLTKGQNIVHNHASTCSKHCQNSRYAGLRGDMCYCLEDIREFEPLNAVECAAVCSWSSRDYCGGKEAISMYSLGGVDGQKDAETGITTEPKHADSRQDWKNCVYLLKHREATWVTADCRKKLPFLCKIYREHGTITEYRSPTTNMATWTEARDICRQEGGTLADLHASNIEAVSALPIESEFWVGLFRNTSWTWHIEMTDEHPHWCTSISTGVESGQVRYDTKACSLPLPYVCQFGGEGIGPQAQAIAQAGSMSVYVACGTVAWILAVLTVVLIIYLLKKRGWRLRRSRDMETSPISTRYADLDEESTSTPRPQPGQPAYVNSEASGQSCSAPSEASTLKPGNSKYQNVSNTCNAYATVNMSHSKSGKQSAETAVDGACRLPSTSSDGEYDLVWDSVKMKNQGNGKATANTNTSTPVENIYTEVFKITPTKSGE